MRVRLAGAAIITAAALTAPPAWQVLALGLLVALGAAGRQALRVKATTLEAREAG